MRGETKSTKTVGSFDSILKVLHELKDRGRLEDFLLPTVMCTGYQGAGVTRLVESLVGIKLPNGGGDRVGTRCPVEFRLTKGEGKPWGSISLCYIYDELRGEAYPVPKEVAFEREVTNLNAIELVLRRAQKALLNPNLDITQFINYHFKQDNPLESKVNEINYTRNFILVKLNQTQTNLSIIDLPGLLTLTQGEVETKDSEFIRELVQYYLGYPRSIILAVVSCQTSISPQTIFNLVNGVDPKGERSIGVLSKPDTLQNHQYEHWFRSLKSLDFQTELGYYIVNNSLDQLDERQYFTTTRPWCLLNSDMRSRLGAINLTSIVQTQLDSLLRTTLPELNSLINHQLTGLNRELTTLPPIPSSPPHTTLQELFQTFSECIRLDLNPNTTFTDQLNSNYQQFHRSLIQSRPVLLLPSYCKSTSPDPLEVNEHVIEYYVQFEYTSPSGYAPERLSLLYSKHSQGGQSNEDRLLKEVIEDCQRSWWEASLTCLRQVYVIIQKLFRFEFQQHFTRFEALAKLCQVKCDEFLQAKFQELTGKLRTLIEVECNLIATWDKSTLEEHTHRIQQLLLTPLESAPSQPLPPSTDPDLQQILTLLADYHVPTTNPPSPLTLSHLPASHLAPFITAQAYYHLAQRRYGDLLPMLVIHHFISPLLPATLIPTLSQAILTDPLPLTTLLAEEPSLANHRQHLLTHLHLYTSLRRSLAP